MNKILTYTLIAILLGTFTMVAPLAVLKPNGHTLAGKDSFTYAEPSGEALNRESMFTRQEEPSASLDDQETLDNLPEEPAAYKTVENKVGVASSLSSIGLIIGLMIVPSFLIGLSVFVYLKKRIV